TLRTRSQILTSHQLPLLPPTLFLPLNSHGCVDEALAGARARGIQISAHFHEATIGDLNTLRYQWEEFEVFVFVAPPVPHIIGWVEFLVASGKVVLWDLCVNYWSPDYQWRDFTSADFLRILSSVRDRVSFIFSTNELRRSLEGELGKSV